MKNYISGLITGIALLFLILEVMKYLGYNLF